MPLTASQSGLGVVKGLFTDDYRGTSNSTSRSSQHPPHSPQSQTRPFQHQQQQQQHNRQFLPSSTSPSSKHTKVTTATTTTNRGQRGRTHSNTTSVIDPSALQYASKFSNSNNNVTVSTTIAGHANVSGSTNSTMALPQGALPQGALQQLHSHHHSSTNTYAPSNSSTTTTFYSGVKLAPPVLSASVEQLGRRASDQKIWYTIQVCPCDLTIITPAVQASASSSTNGAATGVSGACSGGTGVTSIPRKPYKIYRRYEDVADFADQLEEEFTGKVVVPSTLICLQQDTKDSNTAAPITTSTSGVVSSGGYCINGNVPGLGSMAFAEKGMLDGGVSATSTGSNNSNTSNTTNQCNNSSASLTSTTTVALPRLKSRLVLFVTKAVCLQRKEELDRYLQELFTLGPVIAQSRLVAEFFGIWKTDMEVHLSQEDRDPLALHSVAAVTTVFDNENKHTDKDGSMDHDHQEEFDYAPEAKNGGGAAGGEEEESMRDGPTTSAGLPVSKTTMRDSSSPSALRALSPSPLPPPIPSNHASSALEAEALPTYKSSSLPMVDPTLPSTNSQSSSTAASMKKMNSIYLASPSLSPSPSAYEPQDMGWTPSLSTLLPLTSETGDDVDAEMASPIEPTAPIPFGHTHLDPITDGYESGAGTETETIADLTTRTIKKFKSLRRAHTSSHSRQQQQQQQDSNYQEDAHPSPPVRSGSISRPSGGGTDTVPSTPSKAKIMKRSKTIVFRPEVTMQPLSSKNVIPPWNRIPSFANSNTNNGNSNSNNAGAVPISPISPTTPHSATTMSLSSEHSTPNTATSDHHTASPTSFDMDDQYYQQQQQPRKLGMSQSKTMSSISTTPSWSFGNTNNSATADTAATAVVAATTEHPTLPAGSLAALSFSAMSTNSSNSAGRSSLNRNGSISNTGARSMSISSGITPTTTLVAPWNRANAHGETNTHLHSLIKISGQLSPSLQSPTMNSPFIPVELGRSFHKKESQAQKSPSNRGAKDRAVPVLTHPPEARNRNPETTSLSFLGGSGGVKGGSGGGGSGGGGGRARKPGMTHSVSAPGGFLPIMTVSAPDTSSSPSSDDVSEAVSTEDASRASVKAAVTKKRVSLHSPSLSTKQPIGILKNAQRGARKASLTVPGAVMFPVQSSLTTSLAVSSAMGSASALSSPSSSPSTTPIPPGGGGTHGAGTLATTFKIVMDADTIVALQVLEDSSFVLTMPELRSRVKAKLTKSNIQLPDKFDLLWTAPTNSMTLASPSPSPLPLPSPLTPTSGMSAMSIHQTANAVAVAAALDQGVMLKTDEDLHRAIHASRNHKVTLRCVL